MEPKDSTYYRRHLPHYQPDEATYFVTFRLQESLPKSIVDEIRDRKKTETHLNDYFASFEGFDEQLETGSRGPFWLRNPAVVNVVRDAIHFRDSKEYDLIAYCIMPNHVHIVFSIEGYSLPTGQDGRAGELRKLGGFVGRDGVPTYRVTSIIAGLKKHTAMKANKILGRTGPFWQAESYDHVVRSEEDLERIIQYVLLNPVKANLVKDWKLWNGSYVNPAFEAL
jgi:REP element-mobilizing transposase RayT